jgi:hypothetical protein
MKHGRLTTESATACVAVSIMLGMYASTFIALAACTAVMRVRGRIQVRYHAWLGTRQIERWLAQVSRETGANR